MRCVGLYARSGLHVDVGNRGMHESVSAPWSKTIEPAQVVDCLD